MITVVTLWGRTYRKGRFCCFWVDHKALPASDRAGLRTPLWGRTYGDVRFRGFWADKQITLSDRKIQSVYQETNKNHLSVLGVRARFFTFFFPTLRLDGIFRGNTPHTVFYSLFHSHCSVSRRPCVTPEDAIHESWRNVGTKHPKKTTAYTPQKYTNTPNKTLFLIFYLISVLLLETYLWAHREINSLLRKPENFYRSFVGWKFCVRCSCPA